MILAAAAIEYSRRARNPWLRSQPGECSERQCPYKIPAQDGFDAFFGTHFLAGATQDTNSSQSAAEHVVPLTTKNRKNATMFCVHLESLIKSIDP